MYISVYYIEILIYSTHITYYYLYYLLSYTFKKSWLENVFKTPILIHENHINYYYKSASYLFKNILWKQNFEIMLKYFKYKHCCSHWPVQVDATVPGLCH